MKFLLALTLLFCTNAFADFSQAPPSFEYKGKKAVFVDFLRAEYDLTYDAKKADVFVKTIIEFEQFEEGYPLFDLKTKPYNVWVNGNKVKETLISLPDNASVMRLVGEKLSPGVHTLMLESTMKDGVRFNQERRNWENVSSAFFIRDLNDRLFLERYLPTNLEFDQYKMFMDVKVTNTKRWHSLFVNGEKTKINENHYRVEFPEFYGASAVYFHLVPINRFVRYYLTFPSIDGREIPVTIYSNYGWFNTKLKNKAWRVMKELEADYGPYPHDQLIIYGTGLRGGMEYAGATETSLVSLGHELQHAYFAKGLFPANGNSGWLDEAIASWRDKGHQTYDSPFYSYANLGNHSVYTRKTDKRSYEYGRSFMAYLDHKIKEIGKPGLKDFLRVYFEKRKYTTITTELFRSDLEDYMQMSLREDFFRYIYGEKPQQKHIHHHDHHGHDFENPHHPIITEEELNSII